MDLPGIEKLPKDQIIFDLGYRSMDLKIHGLNGHNYRFGVPRLQCKLDQKKSKFKIKKGKLFLILRKKNKEDNWFNSLFRSKGLGEVDSDD